MHHDSTWPWRIPLSASHRRPRAWALVDEADYEWAIGFAWHAHQGCGGRLFAARWTTKGTPNRQRLLPMHRLLLGLDSESPLVGDHINRDALDNRRSNLRAVPAKANRQNVAGRGIYWHKAAQKWAVAITIDGRKISGGYFANEAEALAKAQKLYQELNPWKFLG